MQIHYKIINYGSTNYVFSMGKHRYVEPHIHREMELGLVLEGGVLLNTLGREYELGPGDFWLMNPSQCHEMFTAVRRKSYVFLELQVSSAFFRPYFPQIERLRFTQPVLRASEMDPQSCRILRERLIDAASRYFGAVEWYELRCAAGINRMMECLLGAADFQRLTDEEALALDARSRRMQRVADYIEEHLGEKLQLGELAESEGLTLNYLSHFVRESFGMPFQSVVRRKRCQKAAALLRDTEETPTEISLICGFSALKYMNEGFEKLVGCSPSEYRRRVRDGVNERALELDALSAADLEAARAEGGTRPDVPHFSHGRSLRYLERHGWISPGGGA